MIQQIRGTKVGLAHAWPLTHLQRIGSRAPDCSSRCSHSGLVDGSKPDRIPHGGKQLQAPSTTRHSSSTTFQQSFTLIIHQPSIRSILAAIKFHCQLKLDYPGKDSRASLSRLVSFRSHRLTLQPYKGWRAYGLKDGKGCNE